MNNLIKRLHSNFYLVNNIEETAKFYRGLGFDAEIKDGTVRVKLGDFTLAFKAEGEAEIDNESGMSPKGLGVYTYIEIENIDDYYQFVLSQNLKPSSQPTTWPWGKREFAIKDPDGFKLVFYSNAK